MGFKLSSITQPFTSVGKSVIGGVTGVLGGVTGAAKSLLSAPTTSYQTLSGVDQAKQEGFTHTNPARVTMTEEEKLPLLGSADKPKQA